jgi:VanZ family protein
MPTLLYSGNIGIGQDVATVLRAAARLNGETPLKVLIAGSGKGLATARRMLAELPLPDAEIRPPVPLGQLAELLASGDIHLICQKPGTEGLLVPSKIYSTLAAGRPVLFIGPDDCEVGRIIREGGCGFVVEPGDVEGAREALRELATSETLRERMGSDARDYYDRHFGRDRSVSRIVGILEAAGNGGNGNNGGNGRRNGVPSESGPGTMPRMNDSNGQRRTAMSRIKTIFEPRRLAVAVAGMVGVLVLTHIPQEMMPKQFSGNIIDKAEHAVAYGTIAFLFLLSFRQPPGVKAMLVLLLVGAAVGALDETTQPLVNRIASSLDFAADCIGIALVCGVWLVTRLFRRERGCASAVSG